MRFIHAADLHLDTVFAARSDEVRKRLRDASRESLRRLVDLALHERVHAVVLAGDLFDGERLSFQTEVLLAAEMRRLEEAGIPVVYATGNHDPGRMGARAAGLPWSTNVHLARGPEPVRVEVRGQDGQPVGTITAVGHETGQVEDDLVPRFPPPMGEGAHVAVLHATVLGSPEAAAHARYAPTDLGTLVDTGYHYWALGHIHMREQLSAAPDVHYPGNTQGRTLRERGPKGCLLVDLTDPRAPDVRFHRLGPIQWEDLELDDLGEVGTLDRLLSLTRAAWDRVTESRAQDPPEDWIVRVRLTGACLLWRQLAEGEDTQSLAEEFRHALGALEVVVDASGVHPPFRVEEHLERKDVLGEALRLVRSARTAGWEMEDGQVLRGLASERDPDGYVAELLEGAEEEILARMLDPDAEAP